MTEKEKIELALEQLNTYITEARELGAVINLWVGGNSPADPTPAYFALDITE
jgi:hypothetical protein